MAARLTIAGDSLGGVAAAEKITAALAEIGAASKTAATESVEASKVQIGAARAVQEAQATLAATTIEGGQAVIEQEAKKVAALREEITVAREVASTYKAGSTEQAIAIQRVNRLLTEQIALTGRAGAAAGAAGAAGGAGAAAGAAASMHRREEGAARGFLSRSTGLGGWIAGPGFIVGAGAAIGLKSASDALRSIQEETSQLRGAVENTGKSWTRYSGVIEEVVKHNETLGVKQSETLRGMTSLVRVTGDVEKSQHQMSLAVDISRGAHVGLDAAVAALVQADNGRFRGLQRLIGPIQQSTRYTDELKNAHIKVTDANRDEVTALAHRAAAMDKAQTITNALTTAEGKFAGEARRHMATAEGATDRRNVAVERLQVTIGRGLIPVETALSNAIADVADKLRESTRVADGFRAVGHIIRNDWNALAYLWGHTTVRNMILLVGGIEAVRKATILMTRAARANPYIAIASAALIATGLIIEHWTKIRKFFTVLWEYISNGFEIMWDEIKLLALATYAQILEPFSHLPGKLGGWARDAKDNVNEQMKQLQGDMARRGEIIGNAFGKAFHSEVVGWVKTTSGEMLPIMNRGGPTGMTVGQIVIEGAGTAPRSFGQRVSGPTAGLAGLQGALPGPKGSAAINYAGHAKKSYHYSGEALDIGDGGNPASLVSDWNFLYPLRENFAELIWNPPAAVRKRAPGSGHGYFWGVSGSFTDHTDHIHVAFTGNVAQLKKILAQAGGAGSLGAAAGATSTAPAASGGDGGGDDFGTDVKEAAAKGKKSKKPKPSTAAAGAASANKRTFSFGELMGLWLHAGGPDNLAHIAAAIAKAESGGRSWATNKNSNGSIDYGAWQINSVHGYDAEKLLEVDQQFNAHAAVQIWHGSGFGAWTTYRNGAYLPFMREFAGTKAIMPGGGAQAHGPTLVGQPTLISARAGITQAIQQAQKSVRTMLSGEDLDAGVKPFYSFQIPDTVMKSIEIAEGHLQALRAKLSKPMTPTALANLRQNIKLWEQKLKEALDEAGKGASIAATIATQHEQNAMRDVQNALQRAFDTQTENYVTAYQRATERYVNEFNKTTQDTLKHMQIMVNSASGAFMFGGDITQTPAEARLAAMQQEDAQRQLNDQLSQAQEALATAQMVGDPAQIAEAQKQVDAARRAQLEHDLELQAKVERDAAESQLEQAKSAYEEERAAALSAYQQQRDDALRAYQTTRADQWQHFMDLLADQNVMYEKGGEAWEEYVNNLAAALAALGVTISKEIIADLISKAGPGKYANSAADDAVEEARKRLEAGERGATGPGGVGIAQTGAFITGPRPVLVGEHEPEFIMPWSWLTPNMKDVLGTMMRERGVPGSQAIPAVRMRQAITGAFIDEGPSILVGQPITQNVGGSTYASSGASSTTYSDPVQAAVSAAVSAAKSAQSAAAAAPAAAAQAAVLAASSAAPEAHFNVQVTVLGSAVKERDLALSVKNELIRWARSNGVKIFGGYA